MTDRLRALPWWVRSSLAALTGAAATLGFAPTLWWPVLIVAVSCLTLLALPAPTWRQAAGTGFLFGFAWYLTGVTWMSVIFVQAMIALAALEACYLAVLGVLLRLAGRSRAWPLIAAGCWLLTEYLIGNVPFGGFPWLRLGYTTIDSPLAGLLPLVGVPGAGFALALIAQLLAWVLLAAGARRRLAGALAAVAVLFSGLLGALVPAGAEQGSVRVGYVQGNAPGGGIYGLGEPRTITRNHLDETRRLAARVASGELPQPDLVVWPENGTDMDPFRDAQTGQAVRAAVDAVGVPILVGGITENPDAYERQTAAIVWYPNTGPAAQYDKRNLVPFGEWVPLRSLLEPLFPVVRYVGAQSIPGVGPGVLPVDLPGRTLQLGDVICYEVAYDGTVHDTVRAGAQVNVVQSSNAMYVGTRQVPQQFAITRARAAELRREVLVVTTTGTSGLIRPDGSVAFTLPEFQSASGVVELPLRSGLTPAASYSQGLELAGLALTVVALAWTGWRSRRRKGSVRQNGSSETTQETQ
ncbi:MAG: apolipoprotein N-acyltransferase [Micropruina sp.]|uniref:apolipoprotein N-acyltransferase n=1 Tax=Micropruina sp. TaxID=2737536 RepID=UPI0039E603E2